MDKKIRFQLALICLLALVAWSATLLAPVPVRAAEGAWRAEYYDNRHLSGDPVLIRDEAGIDFAWGGGSPDGDVPNDNFSVRWTRRVHFSEDEYRFRVTSDDGVRLYVDNQLVIDRWYDMEVASHSATVNLGGGDHTLRLEYYEHGGEARVALSWSAVGTGAPRGNILTCVRPVDSWIKVYRLDQDGWVDVNPHGWGPLSGRGDLKLDGMLVDTGRYGDAGHPYRVELWAGGRIIRSVGDTGHGEPPFRVYAGQDVATPWGCPAP